MAEIAFHPAYLANLRKAYIDRLRALDASTVDFVSVCSVDTPGGYHAEVCLKGLSRFDLQREYIPGAVRQDRADAFRDAEFLARHFNVPICGREPDDTPDTAA